MQQARLRLVVASIGQSHTKAINCFVHLLTGASSLIQSLHVGKSQSEAQPTLGLCQKRQGPASINLLH